MNTPHTISAIVILFNPDDDVRKNLLSIARQVDHCIVVDNSSYISNDIKDVADNIIYKPLLGNQGIAKAQNVGLDMAKEFDSEFVTFFDQDSHIKENTINSLYKSYEKLTKLGFNVGVVGPRATNKDDGVAYTHKDRDHSTLVRSIENRYTPVEYTLSSGSFSKTSDILDIGGFKEEFFIDSVDHELCWRLLDCGYKNFIDEDTIMTHMLGENRKKTIFGYVNTPSPIRHYYVFRNWLFLFRLPYVPRKYKIRTTLRFLPKMLYFSLFCGDRLQRVKYIFRGVIDGIIMKGGKYEQ